MTRLQQIRFARDLALRRCFLASGVDVTEETGRREGHRWGDAGAEPAGSELRRRLHETTVANLRQARQLAERQARRR